jgi:hypothetical protein
VREREKSVENKKTNVNNQSLPLLLEKRMKIMKNRKNMA